MSLIFHRLAVGGNRIATLSWSVSRNFITSTRLLSAAAPSVESSSSAVPFPPPAGADRVYQPKIRKLVDEISQLSLIEVSDLNECLKKTLNIPDAPMMAMGSMVAAPAADDDEGDVKSKEVKTAFTVKLVKFEDSKKVALIKEVKQHLENMNLVQAKQFVEKLPQIVKADLAKDEADKLKSLLEAAGGTVEIV